MRRGRREVPQADLAPGSPPVRLIPISWDLFVQDFTAIPADKITPQHYAFLISEGDFDAAYVQIRQRGIEHYADPHRMQPGAINHNDGGRGVYFVDPVGHLFELITVPYGGWTS